MRVMTIKQKDKSDFDHEVNMYLQQYGDKVIDVKFAMTGDGYMGNVVYGAMILLKEW